MYDECQRVYHNHCYTKQWNKKTPFKEVITRYKKEQLVLDIKWQLKDLPIIEEEMIQVEEYIFIERI